MQTNSRKSGPCLATRTARDNCVTASLASKAYQELHHEPQYRLERESKDPRFRPAS
jgi:hypothetical protein